MKSFYQVYEGFKVMFDIKNLNVKFKSFKKKT